MSENDEQDETQPVRRDGAATPPPAAAGSIPTAPPVTEPAPAAATPAEAPVARRGFRERLRAARRSDGSRAYSLGALVASALAGIIVGGLGVSAIDAVAGDDHGPGRDGWVRHDDDRGPGGREGMHGGPYGVPGQLPPTTVPDDEEGSSS
ncbi:hypothetical protein NYO98_11520 [Nocardioides sp. STR2]|uniref:CAP domain-containing protein n=1 Tax=Nocardioides pini TaxID=2975053 RepID=A0ABT4CD69_9ACTN|nr:hypothetical protein [Nocardioides pini]MCY4726907.1 hypothetical protein [Nocardioides pini]